MVCTYVWCTLTYYTGAYSKASYNTVGCRESVIKAQYNHVGCRERFYN